MSPGRSVITGIVGALTLAVCAEPALASGVREMTLTDLGDWVREYDTQIIGVLTLVAVIALWQFRCLKPGGLNAGERDVKPIPAAMWIFCGIATLLGFYLGGALGLEYVGEIEGEGTPRQQAIMTIAAAGVGAVLGGGLLWFANKQAPKSGSKFGLVDLPLGLGLFIIVFPLVVLGGQLGHWIARGLSAVQQDPIAHSTLRLIAQNRDDPWNWWLIGAVVVLIPIVEELIYRAYFQSAFVRVVRSRWVAVMATSGVFVLAHWSVVPEGGKHALATLFVLSLALGASYERTGRLGVPIMIHACFNAVNILLAFGLGPESVDPAVIDPGPAAPEMIDSAIAGWSVSAG